MMQEVKTVEILTLIGRKLQILEVGDTRITGPSKASESFINLKGKDKNKMKNVIIGANYFGLGYASVHPECVIIESSQMLGGDFHQSLRTADGTVLTEEEKNTELAKFMKEQQVWEGERFDLLKASPVIHKYMTDCKPNTNILLNAKVLSVHLETEGYILTYMDNEGIHEIECKNLLDTTISRETAPAHCVCTAKTLNLFTVTVTEDFTERLKKVCPDCIIEEGWNQTEKIVKFPFETKTKMLDAYEQLIRFWKEAFPDGEERVLFVSEDFECVCEPVAEETAPCQWNGGRYANPLTAYAAGMAYQFASNQV